MKVLHVGKYYFPFHGGIETQMLALCEGIAARGHEVSVLCSSHSSSHFGDTGKVETIHGVRVRRCATWAKLFSQPIAPGIAFELGRLAKSHDLIHLHMPNPLAETLVLGLGSSIPLVVTYHSDIIRQRWAVPAYSFVQSGILSRADVILVSSDRLIESSSVLRRFKDKCRAIPFAIDPTPLEKASPSEETRLREKFGRFALFVGRLVPYKGVRYLIEAMNGVPFSLVIVGDGPLREGLEELVRERGLEDRVHFLGEVKDEALWGACYRACEVFVLPSVNTSEAFGMVLLEAMACAKPLVTTNIPSGVSFVNEKGVTGFQVDVENPTALANALKSLFSDESLRAKMGAAARARFDEHFRLDRMIDSYESAYASAIKSFKKDVTRST